VSNQVTIPQLNKMKHEGRKIVGVVAWDAHIAQIADRAGVDILSVGDSIGVNLWGHSNPFSVTLDQMITVASAVRSGTQRALVSCDLPFDPSEIGVSATVEAGLRMIQEVGVDLVKLDGASGCPEAVSALTEAGVSVWAQFGVTPYTAEQYGIKYSDLSNAEVPSEMTNKLVSEAKILEAAGADMLDFTNSGPYVGPAVTSAVTIPVIGGFGGGPWLDGRVRMAHAAIGYGVANLDQNITTYANVANITLEAISAFSKDVREGRQIKGGIR